LNITAVQLPTIKYFMSTITQQNEINSDIWVRIQVINVISILKKSEDTNILNGYKTSCNILWKADKTQ